MDLSFSCRNLREGRATLPTWLVLQAYRLEAPGQALSYEDLERRLDEPLSAVPETADRALGAGKPTGAEVRLRGCVAGRARR